MSKDMNKTSSAVPPPLPTGAANRRLSGIDSKYLKLNDLHWLRNLFFSSKRVVEGQYAGRHSSSIRGHSVEFADYRQYMPGDELSDVDWKVYGRTDRMFIKLFEHQSDMTVNLVVDASASMGYRGMAGSGDSKFDHACMMAAAIGFLTTSQQDKVSFTLVQDGVKSFSQPHGSFKHFCDILRTMEAAKPVGVAQLPRALKKCASLIGRRGLLVVFTDMLEDVGEIFDSLSIFTHRGGEVILFHIMHDDELALPDLEEAVFIDSETNGQLSTNVGDIRKAYEKKLGRFHQLCSDTARGRGIDYRLVPTSRNYCDALSEYLFQRASVV